MGSRGYAKCDNPVNNIKVGKVYDYFDDGKVKSSRNYKVEIKEIVPFSKIDKTVLKQWQSESKEYYWIYNNTTDYFLIGELYLPELEEVVFVRAKDNGWFSLGWWAGLLDHDGSLIRICRRNGK